MKIGFIGLGSRGSGLMQTVLSTLPWVDVTAVCDLYADRAEAAAQKAENMRGKKARPYTDAAKLFADGDVDAVILSSAWESHIPLAIASMKAGIPTAMEVGGAYSVEDCYRLVRTYEETKTPFMFLENCCFGRDELLATAMTRKGLFGDVVHCSGAYAHDLRQEVAYGKENRHYRLRNYLSRNCENYPTHELLPIAKLLNINRGNRMISLVSVASRAAGLRDYIAANEGKVDPALSSVTFKQGDIVDTVITCAGGETIRLCLDTTLPRYYDRGFTVRGTKGMYTQSLRAVCLDGEVDESIFEPADSVARLLGNAKEYEKKYLPKVWRDITEEELAAGHGGMDAIELEAFLTAVRDGCEMPLDVYDAASVMVISCLSEESIAKGGAPVAIPDFTCGAWLYREKKDVMDLG